MINVIFDFESLGLGENSVLLSLGVVAFDPSDFDIVDKDKVHLTNYLNKVFILNWTQKSRQLSMEELLTNQHLCGGLSRVKKQKKF